MDRGQLPGTLHESPFFPRLMNNCETLACRPSIPITQCSSRSTLTIAGKQGRFQILRASWWDPLIQGSNNTACGIAEVIRLSLGGFRVHRTHGCSASRILASTSSSTFVRTIAMRSLFGQRSGGDDIRVVWRLRGRLSLATCGTRRGACRGVAALCSSCAEWRAGGVETYD